MPVDATRDLAGSVVAGGLWLSLSTGGHKAVGFATSLALARLLFPDDFGRFAMASAGLGLAALAEGGGIASFLVRAPDARRYLDSAFWLSVLIGALQTAGLFAAAPLVARFFREPAAGGLAAIVAPTFLLGALGTAQGALLERDLRFREIASRRLAGSLVASAAAVALAFGGAGAASLALPVPLRAAWNSVANWRLVAWRPSRRPRFSEWREIAGFGAPVAGSRALAFLRTQADNLILGRALGAGSLGLYEFAYRSAMWPAAHLGDLARRLGEPALARLAREESPAASTAGLLTAVRWTLLAALPAVVAQWLLAEEWVLVIYGPRWLHAVPLLRLLLLAAVPALLAEPAASWLRATGRPDLPFRVGLVSTPVLIAGFLVAVRAGLVPFAATVAALLVLSQSLLGAVVVRRAGAPPVAWGAAVAPAAVSTALLATALLAARAAVAGSPHAALRLAAPLAAGGAAHLLALLLLFPGVAGPLRAALPRSRRAAA